MEQKVIQTTKMAVDDLVKLALAGKSQLWVNYDKDANVLYISFGTPKKVDRRLGISKANLQLSLEAQTPFLFSC